MNRQRQPVSRCYLHSRSQLEIPTSAGYPAVPIEVEQRRIHLRFAWRAFQNEWNIDFPSSWRRRFGIIGYKWRTGLREIGRPQQPDYERAAMTFD